jgi:hypothetical protein
MIVAFLNICHVLCKRSPYVLVRRIIFCRGLYICYKYRRSGRQITVRKHLLLNDGDEIYYMINNTRKISILKTHTFK